MQDSAESSTDLVLRARAGDREALDRLCARYLEPLRTWASGRLPSWARGPLDTGDLVQETLVKAVRNLETFEPRRPGAFHAYLRQSLKNRVIDEIRRARGSRRLQELGSGDRDTRPSPLEQAIGHEVIERYEQALAELDDVQREAIVARVEFGMTYAEVARTIGSPSANAARMMVSRTLLRLAEVLGDER